ncbi:MAG: co-chaperone DjlA [Pseudomonadota bacterium]
MSWWGKMIGGYFGFVLGGPLGAVLGAAVGHQFDRGLRGFKGESIPPPGDQERVQTAFFTATFSVMGHVAKADGRVTRDEIRFAELVMAQMNLSAQQRRTAINLFNEGKSPGFPLKQVLDQFRVEVHRRKNLLRMFMEIQLQAAYGDGGITRAEEQLLLRIAHNLGIPEYEFRVLERMVGAQQSFRQRAGGRGAAQPARPSLNQAYAVLGLTSSASDAEVKKAYRRLISQHHPDKLVAKGLPEEMMKVATRKTRETKEAYEIIKEARGMR